jgi:hypothetical protein
MREITVTAVTALAIFGMCLGMAWFWVWRFDISWTNALIAVVLWDRIWDKTREQYAKELK